MLTAVADTRAAGPAGRASSARCSRSAGGGACRSTRSGLAGGDAAAAAEDALHAARWAGRPRAASALLDTRAAAGAGARVSQRFLAHGETQGDVLEGFVLLALRVAGPGAFRAAARAYGRALAPGAACAPTPRGGSARARRARQRSSPRCARASPAARSRCDRCRRPRPARGRRGRRRELPRGDALWALACGDACGENHALRALFRALRRSYSHRVHLKAYAWRREPDAAPALLVQVHVTDDNIFYGWRMHERGLACARLFRGMVVALFEPPPPPAAAARAADEVSDDDGGGVEIVAIAKLKCLNYLFRTFGIRNLLGVLLDGGPAEYLPRADGFLRTWRARAARVRDARAPRRVGRARRRAPLAARARMRDSGGRGRRAARARTARAAPRRAATCRCSSGFSRAARAASRATRPTVTTTTTTTTTTRATARAGGPALARRVAIVIANFSGAPLGAEAIAALAGPGFASLSAGRGAAPPVAGA